MHAPELWLCGSGARNSVHIIIKLLSLSSLLSSYSDPALRTPTPPCTVPTQRQRERGTDPPIAVGARRGTGEDAGEGARLRQPRRAAWGFLKPLLRCGWCALSGRLYTTRW